MNISREIFTTDGSNSSDHFIYNSTVEETDFAILTVDIIIILLSFPTNSYVIWLIVTGTGNGLAAEFFILNLSICEMIFCIECLINLISDKAEHLWMAANFWDSLAMTGLPLFQCLICVERYLAVVHPVTFLKFKPLRYRVICCVIAWMASLGSGVISIITAILYQLEFYYFFIMAHFSLFLSIQLFCLVAVLRALKQSGPGERRRERGEENNVKRRAFYIILITTLTILIIFCPYMISITLSGSIDNGQIIMRIDFVCFVLAGLVQPLLFFYRVGKLPFIKCQ